MSSSDFDLDTLLSTVEFGSNDSSGSNSSGAGESSRDHWHEPEYTGEIDYRIRQLSYSSLNLLHTCPRKFELYKRRTTHRTAEAETQSVTFAFGHVVGEGIQLVLSGFSEEEILLKLFLAWHAPLLAVNEKEKKSFWLALAAVKRFIDLRKYGFLKEYKLLYFQGKPACELSFCITLPDGFRLRGFVDAVLEHTETGEILVLECKTTKYDTVNPAMFKNSAQAVGYSIVLDHIAPELSSYKVLYLVYQTGKKEFLPIPFTKTYLQRAVWIRELLLDIETIKMYEKEELYPMRGESCFDFFRECEYLQVCTLSTNTLTKRCTAEEEDKTDYQVVVTLADLLDTQLRKAGHV